MTRLAAMTGRRVAWLVTVVAGLAVLLRTAVFVLFEQAHFDSDQAVFGLMAKHLSELRAFPILPYGEHYMLALEAWMAAPLFWLGGPTLTMLKLPLVAVNLTIVALLLARLQRDSGLAPLVALLVAVFVILPPPGPAAHLVSAGGANVEPLLWTLLLWISRHRPLPFGVIFAIGVLNREFAVYGLATILLLEALDGSLFTRQGLRAKLLSLVAFGATWQAFGALRQYSSAYGPGTSLEQLLMEHPQDGEVLSRFCWDPPGIPSALFRVFTEFLGVLLGAIVQPIGVFSVRTTLTEGTPWLWPILGAAMLFALIRIGQAAVTRGVRPWLGRYQFGTYLFIVGAGTLAIYAVSRCGRLDVNTIRYALLGLLMPVGLFALYFGVEPIRRLRAGVGLAVMLWVAMGAWWHGRLIHEYATNRPENHFRLIADHLEARGIRFATANFWDAYVVTFLSEERQIVAPYTLQRISLYPRLIAAHRDEAVTIRREPCPGGTRVTSRYHVCPPQRP